MRLWIWGNGVFDRPADVREVNKGHGRLEIRGLWLLESSELGAYLGAEYGWPGLKFCGLIWRPRCCLCRLLHPEAWEEQEVLWAAGGSLGGLSLQQALEGLRGHWEIENRLYWVRDVSFSEHRLPGRNVGPGLSVIRNLAINLIGTLGHRLVVDGFRSMGARADRGLSLLLSQWL